MRDEWCAAPARLALLPSAVQLTGSILICIIHVLVGAIHAALLIALETAVILFGFVAIGYAVRGLCWVLQKCNQSCRTSVQCVHPTHSNHPCCDLQFPSLRGGSYTHTSTGSPTTEADTNITRCDVPAAASLSRWCTTQMRQSL